MPKREIMINITPDNPTLHGRMHARAVDALMAEDYQLAARLCDALAAMQPRRPSRYDCAACLFATADMDRMIDHCHATGHPMTAVSLTSIISPKRHAPSCPGDPCTVRCTEQAQRAAEVDPCAAGCSNPAAHAEGAHDV